MVVSCHEGVWRSTYIEIESPTSETFGARNGIFLSGCLALRLSLDKLTDDHTRSYAIEASGPRVIARPSNNSTSRYL